MFISTMATLSQGGLGVFISGLAIIFMGLALVRGSSAWMVAAALLTVPYTYMAGGWAGLPLVIRLLPLAQLLAAYFIEQQETLIVWLCSLPPLLTLCYSMYDILIKQEVFRVLN
ncbi:MAG: hypothetical protein Fur002_17680 [Anaerolineales bacterium]